MKVVCFDLDDTLYKEIDYLKSAYREIATYAAQKCSNRNIPVQALTEDAYKVMFDAYQNGNNAFETLNTYLGLELPIAELLSLYREHVPQISLEDDIRCTLDELKSSGVMMGIISDGREQTQWNKIKALGLTDWINERCIIINTSLECFKPDPYGYNRFETVVRDTLDESELTFIYVGDNLKKDFICPKKRGWYTICLMNDGRNIHSQDFSITPKEYLPDKLVNSILEIIV